jgi:hypothetical protein
MRGAVVFHRQLGGFQRLAQDLATIDALDVGITHRAPEKILLEFLKS